MLGDSLVVSRPSARLKKPLTVVLSALSHLAVAGIVILIPLLQNQALPQIPTLEPLRPPVGTGRGIELVAPPRAGGSPRSLSPSVAEPKVNPVTPPPERLVAPAVVPSQIVRVLDEASSSSSTEGLFAILNGTGNGLGPGLGSGSGLGESGDGGDGLGLPLGNPVPRRPRPLEPTRQVATPTPVPSAPVRRGGDLVKSSLVHQVPPVYPDLAKRVRADGPVVLEAVITREGKIDPARLRVLSGHTLLQASAVDAVRQWRYRPTLLNGQAVEIVTTITVNYTLN